FVTTVPTCLAGMVDGRRLRRATGSRRGAPPSTHLRTPAWPISVCKNGLLKKVLASLYTDMVVIDFNDIDESLKESLAEGHGAGAEILAHGAGEIFDQRRIDPDLRGQVLLGAFQSCFGAVPIRFERVQPIFEYLIKVRQAILDQPVEAFEFLVGIGHFLLECHQTPIKALNFLGTARCQ